MRLDRVRRLGFPVPDSLGDLVYAASFFVSFVVLDRALLALSDLDEAAAAKPSLLIGAIGLNVVAAAVVVVAATVAVWRWPGHRWLCRWTDMDRGVELRLLIVPLLAILAWEGSLYQYNYLLDRAHLFDRFLIVALAVAVVWRPVFLAPFVLQSRILAEQFTLPYGTDAALRMDDLLLLALLAVAGAHLVYVIVGRADSAPVVLVISAAVASHFFIPGRAKVLLDWLTHEELANLASSGYTVGWLGQTGGAFARWMAGTIGAIDGPLRVATLILEVGAVLAVVNYRWLRLWLPAAVLFHVANFLLLGFWFLGWVLLELSLLLFLSRGQLKDWCESNLSIGRAVLTAVAVGVFGPLVFHPPGLAWFDTPVAYGYEVEVEDLTGARYNLPLSAFAPFDQELAFARLQLGDTRRLTGAYGVVASAEQLAPLQQLTTLSAVVDLETRRDETDAASAQQAEQFLVDFVNYANRRAEDGIALTGLFDTVGPLPKYWTGRPPPTFTFDQPIVRMEVFRVTNLRLDDDFQRRRDSVLVLDGF